MKTVHHHQRASIADLINPDEGHRGEMLRRGKQIKDHMKENRVNLRESEIRGRELRELARQPEKEPFKLAQFRGISAKVFEQQDSPRKSSKPANDGDFLTKGVAEKRREDLALENRLKREELDRKMIDARYIADRPSTPRKGSVPKATDVAKLAERRNSDFINKNRIKAATMIPHQSQESKEPARHQNFGKVPNYLEQRKQQWEDEKEEIKRRAPDPNCPKGMCLMPEIERLDTLEILHSSKAEALKQLQALPFVIETPSLKRRQQGLEDKLNEIEKAITLFSKPKVYIANE
jgi:hypothetical protein